MKLRKQMISAVLCAAMCVQAGTVVYAKDQKTAEYEKKKVSTLSWKQMEQQIRFM